MSEATLQSKIVKYLKSKGCYVIKTRPGVGVPLGCTDLIFLLEGFWGALEVKDKPSSPYKPLQKDTIKKLDGWSWAKRVDNQTWPDVQAELERML